MKLKEPQKQSRRAWNILLGFLLLFLLGSMIALISHWPFVPPVKPGSSTPTVSVTIPNGSTPNTTTTAQAGATATATSILSTYNSFVNSGAPAFFDPLNDPSQTKWALGSSPNASCIISNGAYHDITGTNSAWNCFNHAQLLFANFVYRIRMTIVHGVGGGITFRGTAALGYYRFDLYKDGTYTFHIGQQQTTSSVPNSYIQAGLGQTNTIAVMVDGATIDFFINDQYVTSVEDTTLTNGIFGVIADGPFADVAFTNAQIWKVV